MSNKLEQFAYIRDCLPAAWTAIEKLCLEDFFDREEVRKVIKCKRTVCENCWDTFLADARGKCKFEVFYGDNNTGIYNNKTVEAVDELSAVAKVMGDDIAEVKTRCKDLEEYLDIWYTAGMHIEVEKVVGTVQSMAEEQEAKEADMIAQTIEHATSEKGKLKYKKFEESMMKKWCTRL